MILQLFQEDKSKKIDKKNFLKNEDRNNKLF